MSSKTETSSISGSTSSGFFRTLSRPTMAAALAWAFGLMMLVALGMVIAGSIYTAGKNTAQLLSDRINLTLDGVEYGVRDFLLPIERQLFDIRQKLVSQELDPNMPPKTSGFIAGLLTASRALRGIGIVDRGRQMVRQERVGSPQRTTLEPSQERHEIFDRVWESGSVVWDTPAWANLVETTVITARLALDLGDGRQRMLVAAVDLATFAARLDNIARKLGQPVFALHGRKSILGHSGSQADTTSLSSEMPLLPVASDPILAKFGTIFESDLQEVFPEVRGEGFSVNLKDESRSLIYREIAGFTDLPWIIGTHFARREAFEQIRRFFGLIALSVAVSIASIALVLWMGRRMSRPVVRLADYAQSVGALELEGLAPLPPSTIRELDTASSAFNSMSRALHWFEAYVPKRLVQRLIRSQGSDGVASEERVISVMFTDIAGFTRRTAGMSPAAIADFLNRHLTTLQAPIEAEQGTIDKYIGDSVMAFWGAPEEQPDHVLRACRAAMAIREALENDPDAPAIRIGIHTGPALVGNIGAPGRLNYTIVGEIVNMAQRIEQLGKQASDDGKTIILIAATTASALGDRNIHRERIDGLIAKGQTEPMTVYRI